MALATRREPTQERGGKACLEGREQAPPAPEKPEQPFHAHGGFAPEFEIDEARTRSTQQSLAECVGIVVTLEEEWLVPDPPALIDWTVHESLVILTVVGH